MARMFSEGDSGGSVPAELIGWDWSSNVEIPVVYWAPDSAMPTAPWSGKETDYGHWDWFYQYDIDPETGEGSGDQIGRWPAWYYDPEPPQKTPLELALEAQGSARENLRALIAAIKQDRANNPLGNVPVVGTLVGVWTTLRQVDTRQAATLDALSALLDVTEATIEAIKDSQAQTLSMREGPTDGA